MLSMNEPSSYCYNKNVKIDFVKPEIVLIFAAWNNKYANLYKFDIYKDDE